MYGASPLTGKERRDHPEKDPELMNLGNFYSAEVTPKGSWVRESYPKCPKLPDESTELVTFSLNLAVGSYNSLIKSI